MLPEIFRQEAERQKINNNIVVMGDLNIKVGSNNINREEVMGKFGVKVMNDNGERLCDFCGMNGFAVTGTVFSL